MRLPVNPPVAPMLAKRVADLPDDLADANAGWIFEPKWDGFRALVFRDGDEILIQSRDEKSLNRYFPEVIEALRAALPSRVVLDAELVVARGEGLDFEALQMRIHPAASRVKLLAEQIPASVVFFDLLADGDEDLRAAPFGERRARLEARLASVRAPLHVTPATRDRATAREWFRRFEGAGLDGVMAKRADGPYLANQRVMLKVKHDRECDCVVAGFRWHARSNADDAVGSLLLGLYDDAGELQHVGVAASFTTAKRRELVETLAPYRENALANHPWAGWASLQEGEGEDRRMPGAKSRWSQGKDLSWEPLRPELVVEVGYDHMQGTRFRHTAQFRRWRPDKPPAACTFAQLEVVAPHELADIFGRGPVR